MRRGHGAAGVGERLTPAHVAIPERPDAHATDASADEHEEGQAEDVGARAIIEALLHLRVVLRLAARRAHEAKRGAVSTIPSAGLGCGVIMDGAHRVARPSGFPNCLIR